MFKKRIKKDILKKVLIGLSVGLILIGIFTYQYQKINKLEYDLNIKKQVEERATDYTETQIDKRTIEEEFNELQTYKVFDGKINLKHTYNYDAEGILGIHRKCKLTATSNVYYQVEVSLAEAEIEETEDKIIVTLEDPFVDEDTVHRIKNTMHIIEDETSNSLLSSKEDVRKTSQYWEESLDETSYKSISDYYKIDENMDYIKSKAKKEVKRLVETFTDKKVIIKFTN